MSIRVHLAALVIAEDPANADLATAKVVEDRATAAGHEIIKREVVADVESAIRDQLGRWIAEPEIDVIIVTGESKTASAALRPLVTETLPGFTDLFRWLAFQEIGAAAMLSNAEAARCESTFVFVLPASVGLQTVEGLSTVADRGSPLLRYAGATRYTELRTAAAPVTLDIPPLDIGIEDHATNAPLAVLRTDSALDLVDDLLAVELVLARDAIRRDPKTGRSGDGVQAGLDALRATIEGLGARPPSDVLHATVRGALPTILAAAENAVR